MTVRRPLVHIGGEVTELPASDSVVGAGGPTGGGNDRIFFASDKKMTADWTADPNQNYIVNRLDTDTFRFDSGTSRVVIL